MSETIFLFECKEVAPVVVKAKTSDVAVKRGLELIGAQLKKRGIEKAEVVGIAFSENIGSRAKIVREPRFRSIVSTQRPPEEEDENAQEDSGADADAETE